MQRTFDELGEPLHQVTFVVVDLETTGGAAADGGITEIGAVKLRGGECLGTFQTLVNPGRAIPPSITVLTGITQHMVLPAPRIEAVLPSFLEFLGDAVVVGHNVRYDLGFLGAALARDQRPALTNRSVDTCALARRLVRDEVPNCKLGTLADRLRLAHRPSHRALDDALATGDLLHLLLERAAGLGVLGLDDLLALPTLAAHPQAAKLHLTDGLPRRPGVYRFLDEHDRVLYVGKATNLRARVRSYFSSDQRRKVTQLLRETHRIDHVVCASPLEAAVLEVRLIHRHLPRFNRQATTWSRYAYVKLTTERFPRLSVVGSPRPDGALYLGPLPSRRSAARVVEALHTALPLRRCTARIGATPHRSAPCAPAQLGVSTCPCAGAITEADYRQVVDRLVLGLTRAPQVLLGPLAARMADLAAAERFEEAADVRDRGAALATALRRQRRFGLLRSAGRVVLELPGQGGVELQHGRLTRAWGPDGQASLLLTDGLDQVVPARAERSLPHVRPTDPGGDEPVARDLADELACLASWLDREAHRVRLVHADGPLASPWPRPAVFEAGAPMPPSTEVDGAVSATAPGR